MKDISKYFKTGMSLSQVHPLFILVEATMVGHIPAAMPSAHSNKYLSEKYPLLIFPLSPQTGVGEDLSHLPMEHRGGDILLRESKGPIAQVSLMDFVRSLHSQFT